MTQLLSNLWYFIANHDLTDEPSCEYSVERIRADQINNNSAPFVTGNLAWFVDYRMMEYNSDLFWNHMW